MLDTKSTFDLLVTRNASSPDQATRILDNTFYRNVSGALGGTQEYMAMEKLHELHEEGGFDLIVVDTPPDPARTRLPRRAEAAHAPPRQSHLPPADDADARAYLRVASVAVQTFLRTVARVVGSEVIEDVVAFFRAFEGMEEGFRERAQVVGDLLGDPATAFVLVSSPRPRRDAGGHVLRGAARRSRVSRSRPSSSTECTRPSVTSRRPGCGPRPTRSAAPGPTHSTGPAAARLAALYDNLADFRDIAALERAHIEELRARIGAETALAYVPYLAHDVHDFATLREVAELLFDTVSTR